MAGKLILATPMANEEIEIQLTTAIGKELSVRGVKEAKGQQLLHHGETYHRIDHLSLLNDEALLLANGLLSQALELGKPMAMFGNLVVKVWAAGESLPRPTLEMEHWEKLVEVKIDFS